MVVALKLFYSIFLTIYSPGFHNITLSSWQVSHLHCKFESITIFKYFTKDHKSWSNICLNFFSTPNIYSLLFHSLFDGTYFFWSLQVGYHHLIGVGCRSAESVWNYSYNNYLNHKYKLWALKIELADIDEI